MGSFSNVYFFGYQWYLTNIKYKIIIYIKELYVFCLPSYLVLDHQPENLIYFQSLRGIIDDSLLKNF